MTDSPRPDLIFSADVEADGPIPGPYSMLSFGLCVIGVVAPDRTFIARDARANAFYRELRPISDDFLPQALGIGGLDRDRLVESGADPATAMTDAAEWVTGNATAEKMRPVLVGWPAAFDWMFLHWYWVTFCKVGDPFGHAGVLDIKTLAWWRTGFVLDRLAKSQLPAAIQPTSRHTHHALDDAVEQGELFVRLMQWDIPTDRQPYYE